MFVTAALLVAGALLLCAGGILKTFRVLELDVLRTLEWMGLAEEPAPYAPARRRPAS